MRLLEKNKQNLKYALQVGEVPIYERDEDGNIVYIEIDGQRVPVETGETEIGYANPIDFRGNIAMSGGEAEAKSFGVDISEYDAILLMEKDRIPIDETSLLWHMTSANTMRFFSWRKIEYLLMRPRYCGIRAKLNM